MMKKIYRTSLILLLMLSLVSFVTGQGRFGFTAGLGSSTISYKQHGLSVEQKPNAAFNIGIVVEPRISEKLSIQTGISYLDLGTKYYENGGEWVFRPVYIKVPLRLVYNWDLLADGVILGAGVYGAYGVGGKKTRPGLRDPGAIDFGDGPLDNLRRIDGGIKLLAGIEIDGLQLVTAYDQGLLNISPTANGFTRKTRIFSFSLIYYLPKSNKED